MNVGVYTTLIRSVALRIQDGAVPLGIKQIQIMHKPERLQPDMTPYVQIFPDSNFITEEYGGSMQQNRKDGTMNLVVWTEYPIDDRDSSDSVFNLDNVVDGSGINIIDGSGLFLVSGGNSGFLPYLEKLMDYINTTGTGTLNPQLVNSTLSMAISVQNVIKHEMTIEAEILLSIKTVPFTINNRQNA